ncbi:MAG: hypothetical protein M3N34_02165 [Pseudomonadota bacterium]|nr:hypothetical protein [Pseudomonadota bacterium]
MGNVSTGDMRTAARNATITQPRLDRQWTAPERPSRDPRTSQRIDVPARCNVLAQLAW